MTDEVILVDPLDRPTGVEEVLRAHIVPGLLHRAFSVFIFNREDQLLLQRRCSEKRHFRLKWSNSCCGHARPGEALLTTAERRVNDELGVSTKVRALAGFLYSATDEETGLIEREYDWVLIGRLAVEPVLNPHEADDYMWANVWDVRRQIALRPSHYTPWFPLALDVVTDHAKRMAGHISSAAE